MLAVTGCDRVCGCSWKGSRVCPVVGWRKEVGYKIAFFTCWATITIVLTMLLFMAVREIY